MEILLVILFAIIVIASAWMLFKTIYWQKKLNVRLNLSKDKNNLVLFKQGGILLATVLLFGVTVSQPAVLSKLLPMTTQGDLGLDDLRQALSEQFTGLGINSGVSDNQEIEIIKVVTFDQALPAGNYSIIEYGEQWYLVSDNQESVIKISKDD